jgi:hypothetical protein
VNVNELFTTSPHHPIVIKPRGDSSLEGLRSYLRDNKAQIRQLLLKHGGILFREFDLGGASDFRDCCEKLDASPFQYVGGNSPRSRVDTDIYTSTEYPASEVISLHNEMYQPFPAGRHHWPIATTY